jgi:hypothetical protein
MFLEGKSVQKSVGKNQTMEPLHTLLLGIDRPIQRKPKKNQS